MLISCYLIIATWYVTASCDSLCSDAKVAQVAIAWLLAQPTVTSVVLGARTKQQLADNLASVNVKLTEEDVSHIITALVASCKHVH